MSVFVHAQGIKTVHVVVELVNFRTNEFLIAAKVLLIYG